MDNNAIIKDKNFYSKSNKRLNKDNNDNKNNSLRVPSYNINYFEDGKSNIRIRRKGIV